MAKDFIVETSARHIHLTEADFKTLFGDDATLTIKKMLSQPGQYACAERVTVVIFRCKKTVAPCKLRKFLFL